MSDGMTASEINQAAQSLVRATETSATESSQDIESRVGDRAEGLQTGSNVAGGYNYQRFQAPTTGVLTTSLVSAARQEVLKNALKDAAHEAQLNYDTAKYEMRDNERWFRKEQAKRRREEQKRAEAERKAAQRRAQQQQNQIQQLMSGNAAGSGTAGSVKVNTTPTTPTLRVAPPAPTPKISNVGVAQPTQRITSVGVAQPGTISGVGVAQPTQRITF